MHHKITNYSGNQNAGVTESHQSIMRLKRVSSIPSCYPGNGWPGQMSFAGRTRR